MLFYHPRASSFIGRDLIDAHHVENQITGPQGAPFAQKLSLGWVIVGEVCIGKCYKADTNVNSLKTNGLGALNGSGATHDPVSSLVNSESIIVMNLRSSYDVATSSSH
jgi:hypothetical protein